MPSYKSYITGFILSLALTLSAYFAVTHHVSNILPIILALAVIQVAIQLIFFLHVWSETNPRWNLVFFISTLSIICILVVGSIWIMNHLNYNMTPSQMNDYMLKSEGMPN